jgi:hypothetical protein
VIVSIGLARHILKDVMVMHFNAGSGTNGSRVARSIVEPMAIRAFFIEEIPKAPADIMLRFVVMMLEITATLVWRQKWR